MWEYDWHYFIDFWVLIWLKGPLLVTLLISCYWCLFLMSYPVAAILVAPIVSVRVAFLTWNPALRSLACWVCHLFNIAVTSPKFHKTNGLSFLKSLLFTRGLNLGLRCWSSLFFLSVDWCWKISSLVSRPFESLGSHLSCVLIIRLAFPNIPQ